MEKNKLCQGFLRSVSPMAILVTVLEIFLKQLKMNIKIYKPPLFIIIECVIVVLLQLKSE